MTQKDDNKLGFWMLTALVTGNMIGSGIFLLPSSLAKLGSITIISWLFTCFGAFLLALLFAKMALLVPKPGGPYAYAKQAFGKFMGFQTGYSYWLTVWIGNAAIALAAVGYLRVFIPELSNSLATCMTAIALVWLFTLVNIRGARAAGKFQLFSTICKVIPLLLISIGGWWYFDSHNIMGSINLTSKSNFSVISTGASLTLWAFIGVESAVVGADRVRNPQRNIPLATMLGTLISAFVYIISTISIMGMIPAATLAQSTSPFALAAEMMFGRWGGILVAFTAVMSCIGTLNGWTLLHGQIALAAAEDKLFPKLFGLRNRFSVPARGMATTSILVSILLLLTASPNLNEQFEFVIQLAVLTALIPYLYTALAALVIMPKSPITVAEKIRGAMVAILAAVYMIWAIASSNHKTLFYGVIVLLLSVPLFVLLRWSQRRPELKYL